MGTAGRLPHHVLTSRRRTHRRRPTLRRAHTWATRGPAADAAASQLDLPSRFLTPIAETPLRPRMALADSAGEVNIAQVIDLESAPPSSARRDSVLDMPLAALSWRDPFHWLSLGLRDFTRAPAIGLFYGACFVVMGWLLVVCFHGAPQYTLALSAGFVLAGPFVCLGLYDVSRRLEHGRPARLWASLLSWRELQGQLAVFAGVLLVLEMLWGRSAMIVFVLSFDGMPDFSGPLASLMTREYLTFFAAYMAVGAVFAALMFAVSVISMPMMMDRGTDAISAGLASMRLVATQPAVMLLWGGLIALSVALAMLPGFLGLLVVGPVLGHASWHAYRMATASAGARQGGL